METGRGSLGVSEGSTSVSVLVCHAQGLQGGIKLLGKPGGGGGGGCWAEPSGPLGITTGCAAGEPQGRSVCEKPH